MNTQAEALALMRRLTSAQRRAAFARRKPDRVDGMAATPRQMPDRQEIAHSRDRSIALTYKAVFVLGCLRGALTAASGLFWSRDHEPINIACSLVTTGQYASPYHAGVTGPTAHLAPVYPFLLAGIIRLFGDGLTAAKIAGELNAVLLGLLLCCLPPLSRRLFASELPGWIAAAFAILLPVVPMAYVAWEALLCALLLALICWVSLSGIRFRAALTGLLAGLCLLTSPASLPFVASWLLWLTLFRRWRWSGLMTTAAVTLALCLPWMLRNHRAVGVFGLRDDFGLELQLNNNDLAQPTFILNVPTLERYGPNKNPEQARLAAQLGEAEYNRRKLAEAKQWIRDHPARFLRLSVQRWLLFWWPEFFGLPPQLAIRVATLLMLPGLWIAASRRRVEAIGLALSTMLFSGVYSLINAEVRYRIPVLWVSLLLTGFALAEAWGQAHKKWGRQRRP